MSFKKFYSIVAATAIAATCLTGCGINNNAALVKVNGGEDTISMGYANFAARYMQAVYEKMYNGYFGDTMWTADLYGVGTTFEDDIKGAVREEITELYLCSKHAEELGVSLSDEEKNAIAEAADKFISSNGAKTLKIMSADKDTVVKYLTDCAVAQKVKDVVKTAANVEVTKDEAWQRTFTYALFKIDAMVEADGNAKYPTEEFISLQKEAAEDVATAPDFNTAVASLDEKNATTANYVYTKGVTEDGVINSAVLEAAEALTKEGQVSPVIEVPEVGYYVIRLNSDYDDAATKDKMEDLKIQKESEAFETQKDEWLDALDWDFDINQWAKIKYDTMFNNVSK